MTALTKKLPDVLPVRKAEPTTVELRIPHKHLGATGGIIHEMLNVKDEKYDNQGCLYTATIVPSDYTAFTKRLNDITKGEFEVSIQGTPSSTTSGGTPKGGRGGKGRRGGTRK